MAMKMKSRFTLLMLLLFASMTASAQGVLTIVINKGSDNPISVAVVPFKWNSYTRQPLDISDVIGENLKLSGLFKTFNRGDMITQPHVPEDIFVNDWKKLGVQYVVIGSIDLPKALGSGFEVKYYLYDISNGKALLSQTSSGKYLDAIANHISDQVYKRLTGVNGFFSTKLLYVTSVPDENAKVIYRLQMADANGRNVKTILTSNDPIMSPSWSPDGSEIAYVSFQNGRSNVYIQDMRSGEQTLVSNFDGINSAPDWSPDGKQLAMVLSKDGNPEIYLLYVRSKQLQRLTHNASIDTEPRWSPDGKSIVFTSNRGGSPQIYQMTLNDRQVKRLTFDGNYNARGQITADGKHLVFVHQSADKNFNIAALSMENGLMRILTKTELDESPSIAPNGSMIVYATKHGAASVLRMITIDGNIEMEVPSSGGQLREPSWSPFMH